MRDAYLCIRLPLKNISSSESILLLLGQQQGGSLCRWRNHDQLCCRRWTHKERLCSLRNRLLEADRLWSGVVRVHSCARASTLIGRLAGTQLGQALHHLLTFSSSFCTLPLTFCTFLQMSASQLIWTIGPPPPPLRVFQGFRHLVTSCPRRLSTPHGRMQPLR